jgi:hypothetical protein
MVVPEKGSVFSDGAVTDVAWIYGIDIHLPHPDDRVASAWKRCGGGCRRWDDRGRDRIWSIGTAAEWVDREVSSAKGGYQK